MQLLKPCDYTNDVILSRVFYGLESLKQPPTLSLNFTSKGN